MESTPVVRVGILPIMTTDARVMWASKLVVGSPD